jgi:PadR family transcriptional regulator PadR
MAVFAYGKISSYSELMVRRRAGMLLPLEIEILESGLALGSSEPFYGYSIAKAIAPEGGALTAHGTLYKALGRLVEAGLLESHWEEPAVPEHEGRPRRRLYTVTGSGALAAKSARSSSVQSVKVALA